MFKALTSVFLVLVLTGSAMAREDKEAMQILKKSERELSLESVFEKELMKGKQASEERLRFLETKLKEIKATKRRQLRDMEKARKNQLKTLTQHWTDSINPMAKMFPKISGKVDIVTAGPPSKGDVLRISPVSQSMYTLDNISVSNMASPKPRAARLFGSSPILKTEVCNPKSFFLSFDAWKKFNVYDEPYTCDELVKRTLDRFPGNKFNYFARYCIERVDGTVSCLNKDGHDIVALMAAAGVIRLNAQGRAVYQKYEDFAKSRKLGFWADDAIVK